MSTKVQTDKNIELAGKLLKYLTKSRDVPDLPQDVSFVPFSSTDKKLNEANEELLKSISKKEKPVVKAEEPKTNKGAWKLIPVNF